MAIELLTCEQINTLFKNGKYEDIETRYRETKRLRSEQPADSYFLAKFHLLKPSEFDTTHLGEKNNPAKAFEIATTALNNPNLDSIERPFFTQILKESSDALREIDTEKYSKTVQNITDNWEKYKERLSKKIDALKHEGLHHPQDKFGHFTINNSWDNNENADELKKLCDKYNAVQNMLSSLSIPENTTLTNPHFKALTDYAKLHYDEKVGGLIKQDRNWGGWKYFDLVASWLTIIPAIYRVSQEGFGFFKVEGAKKMDIADELLKEAFKPQR
jgi:hypothetical protein